jgi:hypothetical protein
MHHRLPCELPGKCISNQGAFFFVVTGSHAAASGFQNRRDESVFMCGASEHHKAKWMLILKRKEGLRAGRQN